MPGSVKLQRKSETIVNTVNVNSKIPNKVFPIGRYINDQESDTYFVKNFP